MKKSMKNFAALLIICLFFFMPLAGTGQVNDGSVNSTPTTVTPQENEDEEEEETAIFQTVYEGVSQKTSQCMQMISSVLKSFKDMERSVIRNKK
jgi:hypothetical protein